MLIKICRSTKIRFNKSLKRKRLCGRTENADCHQSKSSRGTIVLAKPPLESGIFTIVNFFSNRPKDSSKDGFVMKLTHLQMRSKDRDAAGNIAESKRHIRRYNVDVVGIVVRPRSA